MIYLPDVLVDEVWLPAEFLVGVLRDPQESEELDRLVPASVVEHREAHEVPDVVRAVVAEQALVLQELDGGHELALEWHLVYVAVGQI